MKMLKKTLALKRHRVLGPEEQKKLVFGQQHAKTQDFFLERHGVVHTIPTLETPHYKFVSGYASGAKDYGEEYDLYLRASWSYVCPDKNTPGSRAERAEKFIALYNDIKARGKVQHRLFQPMVTVCTRPDGRIILVDGNHRTAIAQVLGLDLRVYELDPIEHLTRLTTVPDEFYGSKRLKMPYQSIFMGDKEILKGRRPDLLERIRLVKKEDLVGKSVLEIGCNYGGNCFLATQSGAREARGLELSAKIVTSAIRINNYLTQPCLFYVWDLNNVVEGFEPADTAFCFSVTKHVPNQEAVRESLKRLARNVLYFEGHAKTTFEDYKHLIDENYFEPPEFLGYLRDGIHNENRSRMFWRIAVKK